MTHVRNARHGMYNLHLRARSDAPPDLSAFQGFGRFGRMFPNLYRYHPKEDALRQLGRKGGPMDEGDGHHTDDSKRIDAGFIFLGQFIDHDITLDTTSSLERQNDPESVHNFRTPFLELDSVYGLGPEAQPFLYDSQDPVKLLVFPGDDDRPRDLPRNSQGRALIGDPRNDENILIAQLHLAFLLFHNAVVDHLRSNGVAGEDVFHEAQQMVRWHYQYMVVEEFLPLICGDGVVDSIRQDGRMIYLPENRPHFQGDPFMPIEFSVAAYRYGHSQVRQDFKLNDDHETTLFGLFGTAFRPLAKQEVVDWKRFFKVRKGKPQAARKIDEKLPTVLFDLPFVGGDDADLKSLATRNLLRGETFCLPSGQSVARYLCDLDDPPHVYDQGDLGLDGISGLPEAPLWFYVLKEADLDAKGEHLGKLGGRIVAETILGLLELDPMSYLNLDPCWEPPYGKKGKFGIADLLEFAGLVD